MPLESEHDEAFAVLGAASKLRHLDLSWCLQLKGPGLAALGSLGLEKLNLDFCRNLEALPLPLASLQELNISGCIGLANSTDLSKYLLSFYTAAKHDALPIKPLHPAGRISVASHGSGT